MYVILGYYQNVSIFIYLTIRTRFKHIYFSLIHWVAWATYLTFLYLSVLPCEMEEMIVSTSEDCCEEKWDNLFKEQSSVASAQLMFASIIRSSKGMESRGTQRMFTVETFVVSLNMSDSNGMPRSGVRRIVSRTTWPPEASPTGLEGRCSGARSPEF